jgi:hypothetical protein
MRFVSPALALAALLSLGAHGVAAATTTVECGQLMAYTAPDPLAPADGSLTIGLLAPWTIAADASLSPEIQGNLASLAGTGPSCLVMDLDAGGVVTGLDFSSTGSITGSVVYMASLPGEVFDDRLLIPTIITDAYPGLGAVFVASQQAGTIASATLAVDAETGRFTGVDASAHFCGAADLAGNGDGVIGAATIPASVLDATDTARLGASNTGHACADVDVSATIDGSGNLSLTTQVVITLAAKESPPDTAVSGPPGRETSVDSKAGWIAMIAVLAFVLTARRRLGLRSNAKK